MVTLVKHQLQESLPKWGSTVGLASLHLKGRALERFQGYEAINKEIKWTQFYIDVVSRFSPSVNDNLMG